MLLRQAHEIEWVKTSPKAKSPLFYEEKIINRCNETNSYKFNGFCGEWKGNKTKISVTCLECGSEFKTDPNQFADKGKGCKTCFEKRRGEQSLYSDEKFKKIVMAMLERVGYTFSSIERSDVLMSSVIHASCDNGHTIKLTYGNLRKMKTKCFCQYCRRISGSPKKKGFDDVKGLIELECKKRGYIFHGVVDKWVGADKSFIKMTCNNGHCFEMSYKRFVGGNGCKKCAVNIIADKRRLNVNSIHSILKDIEKYQSIKFGGFTDGHGYKSSTTKNLKFICQNGHEFVSTIKNTSCPECFRYGGGGYKDKKPGTLYIQKLFKDDLFVGVKFGITNKSSKERLRKQSSKSALHHEVFFELTVDDGKVIREIEKSIKESLKGKTSYISKEDMPDGYTETVAPSELSTIMYIVKSFEKELTA